MMKPQVRSLSRTLSVAVRRFSALHQLRHGHIADRAKFSRGAYGCSSSSVAIPMVWRKWSVSIARAPPAGDHEPHLHEGRMKDYLHSWFQIVCISQSRPLIPLPSSESRNAVKPATSEGSENLFSSI